MRFNKVEISGVNTAKLKVLKEVEKRALLLRSKEGDPAAREELINGNLRLVLSVLQRFTGRDETMDDLFQVGCIGLIKAIDHFDIEQNVRFSTYAVPMIIGEIRRYLRDNNTLRVSRSMRDIAYHAMQAREKLSAALQREPTVEEIAQELGQKREQVVLALESIVDPISLYEPIFSDGNDTVYVMDQIGDRQSEESWIEEMMIRQSMQSLTTREKKILYLRFMRGRTQMEVAREIGISQAQVSRLEKTAIEHVRNHEN